MGMGRNIRIIARNGVECLESSHRKLISFRGLAPGLRTQDPEPRIFLSSLSNRIYRLLVCSLRIFISMQILSTRLGSAGRYNCTCLHINKVASMEIVKYCIINFLH